MDESKLTIKQAAGKLDISEATVRKYLRDFELEFKGLGSKAELSQEAFQALQEITKLRSNGLSMQEIKELKSQKPSKTILDEIEETVEVKKVEKEEEKSEDESEKNQDETPEAIHEKSEKEDSDIESAASEEQNGADKGFSEEGSAEEPRSRRRGFNYRYVERQISTDSKRVSSLRLRLKNINLPVQDRLFFEEALERRILFLNGWKHILRWITK